MSKQSVIIWCIAAGVLVLSLGYGSEAQAPVVDPVTKIGVVSISQVLAQSKQRAAYMQQEQAKQDQANAELQKLSDELETQKAQLQTYKTGSEDYLTQYKAMVENKSKLDALQDYYQKAGALEEKQWTEEFYKKILAATKKIADLKGLTLVLERSEPDFPIPPEMFVMAVRTHKVLYSKGCYDITADVIAEIDQ